MTERLHHDPTQVLVGRQGIYDLDRSVVGYELLFRGLAGGRKRAASGDQMTAEVLYGALTIGLDHLVSGRMIYCNADRGVLLGELPLTLPPEQTVVEVLESVELDDEVIEGCRKLVANGYQLAADDFVWRPGAEELLELASIVKVDVLETQGAELLDLVKRCKQFDVRLLAEKVEDLDQVERLQDLGFELFQGYAFERPVLVAGATIEPRNLRWLRTAAALLGDDMDLRHIEQVIRSDPGLAVQVMQLASLGRFGETRRRIGNLREALVLSGTSRVQNWVALLLARPTGEGVGDRFTSTLIRARACELLAERYNPALASLGFAAGMLSAVDMLLNVSTDEVRRSLPLSDELSDAAFGGTSHVALLVQDAADFQQGKPNPPRLSGVPDTVLHTAFAGACAWAIASASARDVAQEAGIPARRSRSLIIRQVPNEGSATAS